MPLYKIYLGDLAPKIFALLESFICSMNMV